MFAWSLVGTELEVLTSCDKLKLGNKNLEVYQMLVQHIARHNSGLSLARRKDATCFLRWIMSVMTNSTVQSCHQKAMGSKTMQRRVGKPIGSVPAPEEDDVMHEKMMELGPLLEASGQRNLRSTEITHGECPCHCLA